MSVLGSLLSFLFLGIMLLSIGSSFLFGKSNAKFRCISIAVAAVAAFIAALIFKANISSDAVLNSLISLLESSGEADLSEAATQLADVAETLLSVSGAIIAPMVFLVFFILFSIVAFVVSLIVWVIKLAAKGSKKNGFITRVVTGAISGLIVVICLLIPISTYSKVVSIALPELESSGTIEEHSELANIVNTTESSLAVKTFRTFGGSLLGNALTNIKLKDNNSVTTVKLTDETANIAKLYSHVLSLTDTELKDYSQEEADTILSIGEDFANSKLITKISCEALFALTEAWKNDTPFLGVKKPNIGESFTPAFDEMIIISNSDAQNSTYLGEDIVTIAQLVSHLVNAGIFSQIDSEPTELIHTLTSDRTIGNIISTLNENQRMKRLIPILSNIGLTVISDSIGIPADKQEVYNNLMSSIASKLNNTILLEEAERTEKIAEVIMSGTHDAGVDVAGTEATILATSLIQYFGTSQNVSGAEVANFFTEVGEAMKMTESDNISYTFGATIGKLNEGSSPSASESAGKLLKKILEASAIKDEAERKAAITAAVNDSELYAASSAQFKASVVNLAVSVTETAIASSLENVASLSSEEKATQKITKITLDDIVFNTEIYLNSTATPEEINRDMTNVFTNAAIVAEKLADLDDLRNSVENFSAIADSLGSILDILANNDIYGKTKTHDLFEAMIASELISDSTGLKRSEVDEIITNTNDTTNYSSVVGVMSDIISIADGIGNKDIEEEHVYSLIKNLNRESVVITNTLLSTEKLEEFGFRPKNPEIATDVIHHLFNELAMIEDPSLFDAEVKAVEHLLELATIASHSSIETKIFGEGGALGETADQFIEDMHSSTAVCNTLEYSKQIAGRNPFSVDMNDGDYAEFTAACDRYLVSNPTAEAKSFIDNIKYFFTPDNRVE